MRRYICIAFFFVFNFLNAEAFTPSHFNAVKGISKKQVNKMNSLHMSANGEEKKKETTWDRITGPKLFKTVTNWNGIHSAPLVPLRILTGLLMIHHVRSYHCFL